MRTCGESPRMRVIGMLGGMSQESTAQYYRLCSLPRRGTGDTQGRLRRRGRAHAEVRLRARRLGRAGAGPRARRALPGGARRQPRNLAIDTGQAACAASPRDAVGSGNRGAGEASRSPMLVGNDIAQLGLEIVIERSTPGKAQHR
jgi:hypothetical protein